MIKLNFRILKEHKEAQSRLKESETRFSQLAENVPIGIAVSRHGKTIYANRVYLDMFGFEKREEVYGTSHLDQIVPQFRDEVIQRTTDQEQGLPVDPQYEYQGLRKDGSSFPCQTQVSRVDLSDGPAMLGFFTDITNLKISSARIEYLAAFPELSPNPVIEITLAGNINYSNPASQIIFPDLVSLGTMHPCLSEWPKITTELILKKNSQVREIRINGHFYEQTFQYIDSLKTIRIYSHDITKMKRAETDWANSEKRYRRLFEAAQDGILILDADTGAVVDVNPFLVKMLGFTYVQLLGKTIWELEFMEDFIDNKEKFEELKEKGYVRNEDIPLKTAYGKRLEVEFVSNMYEVDHSKVIQCNIRDITDRKTTEAENIILRDKSEISNRLTVVGEMAAGIAHEINNPLTGVIGFSELLMERKDLSADVMENLRIINDGSVRVKDIIKRLLTFARQAKPMKSSVSVNELIDNTLEMRGYVLKTANIEIVKNYDPDLPWIYADPGQLQQVFLNLIINAEYIMKTTHDKGKLTISSYQTDKHIILNFKDDGLGMTDEVKAKIFQPFFSTKAPGEGTGLGLGLSRSIILEHQGTIEVNSMLGIGTTFTITLPITQLEDNKTKTPQVTKKVIKIDRKVVTNARILVVDDEATVSALIKSILSIQGHVVDEANNPEQALKLMEETSFDLIFLDIRMPGVSGMELHKEILTRWPKQAEHIVFITGDTSDLPLKKYMSTQNVPIISKPFNRQTLEEVTDQLLKK